MRNLIDQSFAFQEKALQVRGYRQQLLASNIANADTPNYKARDIDFKKVLQMAQSGQGMAMAQTSARHLDGGSDSGIAGIKPMYRNSVQPSIDGNTVDMNVEQAQFAENSMYYMTTLQFINGKIQSTLAAMRTN